ncbi:hypothetical protein [Pseudomonas sp. NPDC089406]|uniref:hypothetical protein n=1 Tax=Pseudomonas sp. NPDC089406 TaxID=3364463 RepID=UPI00384AF15F
MDVAWQVRAFPLVVILLIYLPAACIGQFLFQDESSRGFLILLLLFSVTYWFSFPFFARLYRNLVQWLALAGRLSTSHWTVMAYVGLLLYGLVLAYASWLAPDVPLLVALKGGSLLDIAHARSQYLAGLKGEESLLRYAVFILGRAVVPLILAAAFITRTRFRYGLMFVLLLLSLLSMEKAGPIFVLLPLVLHFAVGRCWGRLAGILALLIASIMLASFLAMGGAAAPVAAGAPVPAVHKDPNMKLPPGMPIDRAMAPGSRSLLPYYLHERYGEGGYRFVMDSHEGRLTLLLNRIGWVPYITAYDWLEFQRIVMEGSTTNGRSINFVHRLYGEPKMHLEKMVYVFEYGASPGGEGASNTVFFVDAKLAFGWLGALVYCLIFTFCAACIFTSGSRVLIVSSSVCFIIASVSSLTATLLSGGLFIYVLLSLLLGDPDNRAAGDKEFAR